MLVGYVRVWSAEDRHRTDLRRDALLAAGVGGRHIHEDKTSDTRDERPARKSCLDYTQAGDVLVVMKMDRLGRSLAHLIDMVGVLRSRGIRLR